VRIMSVMLVAALVTVLGSFHGRRGLFEGRQSRPQRGRAQHEINEPQNRLHHTLHHTQGDSKQNHLERKIDELQHRNRTTTIPVST
jgi:hypothetical protein